MTKKRKVKMKTVKYVTRIMLLFIFGIYFYSCIGPVPVDVVMIDNELFFVLEEEHEISAVGVAARNPNAGEKYGKLIWSLSHDLTTEVKKRKYPRLKQIKYGQKLEEFTEVMGPFELQKNVEYSVRIGMGNKFAREIFIITDDNKAIMPHRKVKGKSTE
ncbi:MAG: hypothetical protein C0399_03295 [Syntrophus sp. (in: bacteria)]|nr:hypothetical protein [Syntrophus sp. (in: bacteria)]